MTQEMSKIEPYKISKPKGGGAVKGMGTQFDNDASTGMGSFKIPFPVTSARGLEPSVSLSYNSASGNSAFGIGFDDSSSRITRRRPTKGIPHYDDTDVFDYNGQMLVCVNVATSGTRTVKTYQPRTESRFDLINHIIDTSDGSNYWEIITSENTTIIFGSRDEARISDINNPDHIAAWLIETEANDRGDLIQYNYVAENDDNVPNIPTERNRALTQKYLSCIQYGVYPDNPTIFAFQVYFDYGQYDLSKLTDGTFDVLRPTQKWSFRPDPFSSYTNGFEIRTRRRCMNIFMVHNFLNDLSRPIVTRYLSLDYQKTTPQNPTGLSILSSAQITGCLFDGEKYTIKSLPDLSLGFSGFQIPDHPEFKILTENKNTNF